MNEDTKELEQNERNGKGMNVKRRNMRKMRKKVKECNRSRRDGIRERQREHKREKRE